MESRSLVPHQSSSFKLPIANLRNVFRPHDVEHLGVEEARQET